MQKVSGISASLYLLGTPGMHIRLKEGETIGCNMKFDLASRHCMSL